MLKNESENDQQKSPASTKKSLLRAFLCVDFFAKFPHLERGRFFSSLLDAELVWAKGQITSIRSSRIKVHLKSALGTLEKTKWVAEGTVDFKIDLYNETDSTTAELDAVYFYCSKGWKLYQDGKDCSSTDSDIADYPSRHFLVPPVRRLNRKSWAQLKFSAKKVLAWATSGQELKDSYRLAGRSAIRLVTAEGHFDYELPLDVEISEVPF